MMIARILYPVRTLGRGDRVGIWFRGCPHRCPLCANPELWEEGGSIGGREAGMLISVALRGEKPDGFTITGGEPFAQPDALARLVRTVRGWSRDILVYTGYTLEELRLMNNPDADWVLRNIAALIDGRYIDGQNDGAYLRGSSNQTIHILDETLRKDYEDDLSTGVREIQNFAISGGAFSVGIHPRGFRETLNTGMNILGLEERA